MLPSVKNADSTKTKVLSKREEKKRINIRWNSGVFFQVGLAVCLLLAIWVMESDWNLSPNFTMEPERELKLDETRDLAYVLEVPKVEPVVEPVKKVEQRVVQQKLTDVLKVVDNKKNVVEAKVPPAEIKPNIQPARGTVVAPPKKEIGSKLFDAVQFVPIFPGCESLTNNAERKACMSSKINKFINRRFNTDKFSELESGKTHRVNVQFTVGRDGKVKDILARAQMPELEAEAQRVIAKIPEMEPGKHGDTEVDVIFSVPILFQVQ
ncbi:MAG: energy transducer TonB [Bacteroidota bacterium]